LVPTKRCPNFSVYLRSSFFPGAWKESGNLCRRVVLPRSIIFSFQANAVFSVRAADATLICRSLSHVKDWGYGVQGKFTRINFREDFYVGGYSNYSLFGDRTGVSQGLVGCVRRLDVNRKQYDMRRGAFIGDALHGFDVGQCMCVCVCVCACSFRPSRLEWDQRAVVPVENSDPSPQVNLP